jgi:hypothetical protein
MTPAEANDYNTLLEHLLNLYTADGGACDRKTAVAAAARLADNAHATINACLTGREVERLWAVAPPRPSACAPRTVRGS